MYIAMALVLVFAIGAPVMILYAMTRSEASSTENDFLIHMAVEELEVHAVDVSEH